jgi:hypothetical protein
MRKRFKRSIRQRLHFNKYERLSRLSNDVNFSAALTIIPVNYFISM